MVLYDTFVYRYTDEGYGPCLRVQWRHSDNPGDLNSQPTDDGVLNTASVSNPVLSKVSLSYRLSEFFLATVPSSLLIGDKFVNVKFTP